MYSPHVASAGVASSVPVLAGLTGADGSGGVPVFAGLTGADGSGGAAGSLPFTGAEPLILGVVAFVLLSAGLAVWRALPRFSRTTA
jgi:hypothetical protein